MVKTLRFMELQLEGIGPYGNRTQFTFDAGMNIYVGENERGKSTMALGILAVIYGLPHGSSQEGFDFSRFRNPAGDRHEGELSFSVNDTLYGIRRNFSNHEVILWKINQNGEKDVLMEGTHNPRAKKPFKAYEEMLEELVGIGEQSLFENTFFITQPLPETMEISGNVQSLVIGKRGSSLKGIGEILVNRLKSVTKYTGPRDLGITARNMGKEGRLEEAACRYEKLKDAYESGKNTAEELVEVQSTLLESETLLGEKKQQLKETSDTLQALTTWENLNKDYDRVSRDRIRLKNLLERINHRRNTAESLNTSLENEYPEFDRVQESMEEDLRKMVNDTARIKELIDGQSIQDNQRRELLKKKQKNDAILSNFHGWELLGSDPVDKLKGCERSFRRMIDTWVEMKEKEERLEGLKTLLMNEYAIFEGAEEGSLEFLKQHREKLLVRKGNLEKAERALKAAEEQFQRAEDAKAELHQYYGEIPDFSQEGLEAVHQKIPLIQREKELRENILRNSEGRKAGRSVPAVGGFLVGGLGWLAFDVIGGIVGLILGVLMGILIQRTIGGRDKASLKMESELKELKEKIDSLDRLLGTYSTSDAVELTRLAEGLKQKKRAEEKLRERMMNLDEEGLEELREKAGEEGRRLNALEEQISPYREVFEDPDRALEIWKKHRATAGNLQDELNAFYEQHFHEKDLEIESSGMKESVKDQEWKDLFQILSAIDSGKQFHEGMTVKEFFQEALKVDASWWAAVHEKADTWYKARQKEREIDQQMVSIDEKILELSGKEKTLRKEIKEMENKWETPLNAHQRDPQRTLERYREYVKKIGELDSLRKDIDNLIEAEGADSLEHLEKIVSLKEDEAGIALGKWKEHIKNHPALPEVDEETDRVAMAELEKTLADEKKLLKESIESLEEHRLNLRGRKAALEGTEPVNLAAAELELKDLEKEISDLELKRDALALAHREMEEAVKEYRQSYQENLEEAATNYWRQITGKTGRSIVFGDNMEILVKEDGRELSLHSLSKGAKDQLFLSLRFALGDLLSEELKLPFVFDDPFTGTDHQRLERIKDAVDRQKKDRQIFILSHQHQFRHWGNEIDIQ